MEYPIHAIARAAGTTSRTLRHYDNIGLLAPSRVGHNGYRYYDDRALVRLQRVLLLRGLGLGLDAIGAVLQAQDARSPVSEQPTEAEARVLAQHRELLLNERQRIEAQIASVDRTIAALRATVRDGSNEQKEESLMAQNIFDGFDHTQHLAEVKQRWGADAAEASGSWWKGLGDQERRDWQGRVAALSNDWVAALVSGVDPTAEAAQSLARRHIEWLRSVPGAPAGEKFAPYVLGLAEMYVADERFAANYGGVEGAALVRDALHHFIEVAEG